MFVSSCLPPPTPFGILPPLDQPGPGCEVRPEPRSGKTECSKLPKSLGAGIGSGEGLLGASQVEESTSQVQPWTLLGVQ